MCPKILKLIHLDLPSPSIIPSRETKFIPAPRNLKTLTQSKFPPVSVNTFRWQ